MENHKRTCPAGGDSQGYAVGYGKPPLHTRFQSGRSGNPAGRPKGMRNLSTDVRRILKVPVKINEGGRSRKVSTQEGTLMRLREKALKGDARALDRLLDLAARFNNEPDSTEAPALSADDQAILADYVAKIAPPPVTPTPAESPRRERVRVNRRPEQESPK
jgi:Family of unknown function (DUF5681)